MTTPTRGIDQWRDYFRSTNSDIFEIIEQAIIIAATDCPEEFKHRKLQIAEILFTARLNRCTSCNRVELQEFRGGGGGGGGGRRVVAAAGGSKESKANSSWNDDQTDGDLNHHHDLYNPVSNYSYGDAEALTDEIEEEDRIMEEVLRFKQTLNNYGDESDTVIYDILRRLQLMRLNVDVLKETEIGKTVMKLRKHASKQIRHLCYEMIAEWKALVDEWAETRKELELAEGTPDSMNPTIVNGVNEGRGGEEEEEEVGLPSPPLDEGAFFTSQSIDFSKFFDGMDDDGNPRNNAGESNTNKNQESGRRPSSTVKQEVPNHRTSTSYQERVSISKAQQLKPQQRQSVPKPTNDRPTNMASGPGRPLKPHGEQKVPPVVKSQQGLDKPEIPRRPTPPVEKARGLNVDSVQEKLEVTKRKLQERYQEAQNAKRQRKIQVMELHDLPKQNQGNRNTNGKFGNRNGRK